MLNRFLFFVSIACVSVPVAEQEKWTLQDCIDYAIKNNVSVKEADVQKRLSALTTEQAKASFWPTLNFSGSSGYRFGLSENPTTGILQSSNFFSSGFSVSGSATLFNWFAKRHQLKAAQAATKADEAMMQKTADDVELAVSAAFLQALLAKEVAATAALAVQQSATQLEATVKKIRVGVLSELDAAQVRQQLLIDSLGLFSTQESFGQAMLQLKAVMALDAGLVMELQPLPVDDNTAQQLLATTPAAVYATALKNLPQARSIQWQAAAAEERIKAAAAAKLPTFSLYGSAGSNFVNISSAQSFVYLPQQPTGSKVLVNGVSYDVLAPSYSVSSYGITPFFRQLHKNFGQNFGVSLSVPILNGKAFVINQKREILNAAQMKLQQTKFEQELQTAVYTAYTNAVNACKKLRLSTLLIGEAMAVFDGAKRRYALNLLSTQDLLLAQNNLQKVRTDALLARYDFSFKLKLFAFYKKTY